MEDRYLCRAKRTHNGEWVEGSYVYRPKEVGNYRDAHYVLVHDDYGFSWKEIDIETLCQYTGLTEGTNRKWEGDIFTCDGDMYVITYSEDSLCWEAASVFSPETISLGEFHANEINVISNIFDNPELMEGGK